jgi:bidirectional [NiFe] hydrogenase diaphorase subunit
MKMEENVTISIDGKEMNTEKGTTILEAAKQIGVNIPTLCYNEELDLYGACRMCIVEIEKKGKNRIVAACCYPVEDGLKIQTNSPKIFKMRRNILELAGLRAGEDVTGNMQVLVSEYNADLHRYRAKVPVDSTKCILCGLCVRRCKEATWDSAIGFVGRGIDRQVVLFPEKASLCLSCNYCYNVCPTGKLSPINSPYSIFPNINDILAGRA